MRGAKLKMRKTPRVLRLAKSKNLGDSRVDDDPPRAKLQGFAPGMWDPREVVQNAKLIVNVRDRDDQCRDCRTASQGSSTTSEFCRQKSTSRQND
jgi:hypothetical protein